MKSEPADEFPVKRLVDGILRPAGSFGLQTCPCRVECLEAAVPVADSSEAVPIQVLEQEALLKLQERTRHATGGFKNLGSAQQAEAEGMQGSRSNLVHAAIHTQASQLPLEVPSGRSGESADQHPIGSSPVLKETSHASHQGEGLTGAWTSQNTNRRVV